MSTPSTPRTPLTDALAMQRDGQHVHARVHEGFDVYGIPHGGYLAALAARAVLTVAEQPDLFTISVHFLRKAEPGPLQLAVQRIGGSRRFTTHHVTAEQGGDVVLTALASVGDRTGIDGPEWSDAQVWDPAGDRLSPPAGTEGMPFEPPAVAAQFGMRLAEATAGFAIGRRGDRAVLRVQLDTGQVDQATALVACDITPPAVWNALGAEGWVPTVELTAHVRTRPAPGPLSVEAATHHVQGGFLEEDAVVRDASSRLVVQSRQLARWTST